MKFKCKCKIPIFDKGEGQNFEQYNFRMADVSYVKIKERSNIERPILRE